MSKKAPMLVGTVSVGAGHVRAAEALYEALVAADPVRPVEAIDVLDVAPAWVRRFYRESFLRLMELSRRLAYVAYVATDRKAADDVRWGHVAERAAFRRFRRLLRRGAWEDCVCTHFLPCQLAYPHPLPRMHLVVTDWALHSFWMQPFAADFFVATEAMAAAVRRRLPGARAYATGIPVRGEFRSPRGRIALRRELGLDVDAPVVVVIGGGWGLGLEAMVREVLAARVAGLRVEAVCGMNAGAQRALVGVDPERLRVHGFVDDPARLIGAADLVVSKPGGVTTSEALALGKPLLLTRGLPGHEDRNLRHLTAIGAACEVASGALGAAVERFFGEAGVRERCIAAARGAGRPDAAARIVAILEGRRSGDPCAARRHTRLLLTGAEGHSA